jgi:hypothetical protein
MRLRSFEFRVSCFEFKPETRDPKPVTPDMRLTSEILLNSLQRKAQDKFGEASRIFKVLRSRDSSVVLQMVITSLNAGGEPGSRKIMSSLDSWLLRE